MLNLLLANDFTTVVLPVARWVFVGLIALSAVVLIITTLLQSSSDDNSATALTGQESYYSQNKGESRDGKLKRFTIIFACVIAVCTVLYFITWAIT